MDKLRLVTFGIGGHTEYYDTHTIHGYERPNTVLKPYHWWADPENKISYHIQPGTADGVPVINTRNAVETKEGFKMAINGPMVDVTLPDGEIDQCPEPSPVFAGAVSGNQFGTLLKLQEKSRAKSEIGPLDSVSIAEYARRWKEVGAQVGVIKGDKIVWDV